MQFQLIAVAFVLLLLLVAAAVWLSDQLVRSQLISEAEEAAVARTSATESSLSRSLRDAPALARPLAIALEQSIRDETTIRRLGVGLLESAARSSDGIIIGLAL